MPILYEGTDSTMRYYNEKTLGKLRKFGSSPGFVTGFLAGLVSGFIVLPIVLPIVGYQVTKRWGPPGK